jgi:RNA polymerase sigma-70 factor (ECF subfamily)
LNAELVQRAQGGDREAFDRLVTERYAQLFAIAGRILRQREASEDAVQDAVIHAWRNLRGLREPDRFDAWLHRLLVNACRDQGRRSRRRVFEVQVLPIDADRATDELGTLVDRDELDRAFRALPMDQRIALVLTHYCGYTAAEAGALLGVPTGTIHSRIHYGGATLRAALTTSRASEVAVTR